MMMKTMLLTPCDHDIPKREETAEESDLCAQVERAVRMASGIYSLRVQVIFDCVHLFGKTSTYGAKKDAQDAAMKLVGMRTLYNLIEVVRPNLNPKQADLV